MNVRGWVYTGSESGVRVFSAEGGPLAPIPAPQTCSNRTFGGADGSRLFPTSGAYLHAVDPLPESAR